MDANKLKETRLRLSIECERLIRSINFQRLADQELRMEQTEDESDLATINQDRNILHNLHESGFTRLRFIQEAIKTIDSGHYGECVDCGNDIGVKRLEAVPWARMCFHCQEVSEQGSASSRVVLAGGEREEGELYNLWRREQST